MQLAHLSVGAWPAWAEVTRLGAVLKVRCLPCDFVEPDRIQRFHRLVQREINSGADRIELDLTLSEIADTKLVALLVLAHRRARRQGVELRVNASDHIRSLVAICRCQGLLIEPVA
ncbi:MAG: hypothetical protein GY894_04600 [Planctomycetes bacterium]|nr:hypothetical protein [Planctomycetota bacterium]MCP4838626.1 hypothetical protein [Planctomycetota bacterium]